MDVGIIMLVVGVSGELGIGNGYKHQKMVHTNMV